MLAWAADRYPRHRAVGGASPLTYGQWDARTSQLARALASLGVRSRDRVAFVLGGGEPMASLHLAVQKLGAVSVRFPSASARPTWPTAATTPPRGSRSAMRRPPPWAARLATRLRCRRPPSTSARRPMPRPG